MNNENILFISTNETNIFNFLNSQVNKYDTPANLEKKASGNINLIFCNTKDCTIDYIKTKNIDLDSIPEFYVYIRDTNNPSPSYTQLQSRIFIIVDPSTYRMKGMGSEIGGGHFETMRTGSAQGKKLTPEEEVENTKKFFAESLSESAKKPEPQHLPLIKPTIIKEQKIFHRAAPTTRGRGGKRPAGRTIVKTVKKLEWGGISQPPTQPSSSQTTATKQPPADPTTTFQNSNVPLYILIGGSITIASIIGLRKFYHYWYPQKEVKVEKEDDKKQQEEQQPENESKIETVPTKTERSI